MEFYNLIPLDLNVGQESHGKGCALYKHMKLEVMQPKIRNKSELPACE